MSETWGDFRLLQCNRKFPPNTDHITNPFQQPIIWSITREKIWKVLSLDCRTWPEYCLLLSLCQFRQPKNSGIVEERKLKRWRSKLRLKLDFSYELIHLCPIVMEYTKKNINFNYIYILAQGRSVKWTELFGCQTRLTVAPCVALEQPMEIDVRTGFKAALNKRCP